MFFQGLSPQDIIIRLIVLLIAMTVHEFAHAYVAYLMGDPTAKNQGRLTLNPMVHIDWFGFLMFVIVGFGVLGSAPVNPYRMRNPRWGYLAAVAAGPFSNLLLAGVFAIIYHILQPVFGSFLWSLMFGFVYWNVLLFLFNLIPLGPLDGWSIVYTLLPPDLAVWWERNRQNTYYILLGLILASFVGLNILGPLISEPAFAIIRFLLRL